MTALPASGYIANAARTEGEQKQALEDLRSVVAELPGASASTTLTIAAGSITPTLGVHSVDTEGAAASDDLTNINQANVPDGRLLLIRTVNAARDVVVKHQAGGAGEIVLNTAADFTLDDPKKWLLLERRGTLWVEVDRFLGADAAAGRSFIGANARTISKSAAYTLVAGDRGALFLCNATTAPFTMTLLAAAAAGLDFPVGFQKDDASANAVTIDGDGAETIDGTATVALTKQYEIVWLQPDGANWRRAVKGGTAAAKNAAAGSGDLLPANGDGSQLTGIATTPRSYLAGYGLANNGTDPTNDIDIAVGTARDSTDAATITLASALIKRLDANWVVGTNQGMLDTGAVGNGTYHIFAIRRPDTGVVDILASLSATAPTMPTNYTQFRRIGSIVRAAGAILAFAQTGDEFLLNAVTLDITATNPGTAAVLRALVVPTGIVVGAIFNWNVKNDAGVDYPRPYFSSPLVSDQAPADTAAPLESGGALVSGNGASWPGWGRVTTNTSAQVRSRLRYSDANITLYMATLGWIDRRGRDA